MKNMSSEFLCGAMLKNYGATCYVGIGIPIPVLNERVAKFTAVRDEEIYAPIVDYSQETNQFLGEVNYKQLRSGKAIIGGKEVSTGGISSYKKAREIAGILKKWIKKGKFFLTQPVAKFPGKESEYVFRPLRERR